MPQTLPVPWGFVRRRGGRGSPADSPAYLADLRERLGASAPTWRRWQDFKRRVLEPACAEINQLTGVGVAWEPIKYGRKVMGVRLSTWRKSAAEIAEAGAELARHRAGRKERRHELAELRDRRAEEPPAAPAADPRQTDLEEAIAAAGVQLTPAQLMLGADAARAESGAGIDIRPSMPTGCGRPPSARTRCATRRGTGSTTASGGDALVYKGRGHVMSPELIAILAVGVAVAGIVLNGQRIARHDIDELRRDMGELRERMAKLEGLLEGLREAISGRRDAA